MPESFDLIRTRSPYFSRSVIAAAIALMPIPALAAPDGTRSSRLIATAHLGFEHTIAAGESLDGVLAAAGTDPSSRTEAAQAISGVYDLADLQPGDVLNWQFNEQDPRELSRLSIRLADGTLVQLNFATATSARLVPPETQTHERQTRLTLDGPLIKALTEGNAPQRFAVELAAAMAGQVDFRRDVQGGETLDLLWEETITSNGVAVGEPRLRYARLAMNAGMFELITSEDADTFLLLKDGDAVQVSAPPIKGARLSSVFGRRSHPVLGSRRMHTGVDYAAPIGTPVTATGARRVIFAGTMRGYGLTLDIDHGAGVVTRYAHLSKIEDGVRKGQRFDAGSVIGAVGATGLVSGPNLHYEVRLDGQPVDPTSEIAAMQPNEPDPAHVRGLARARQIVGQAL